ncbi:MAG: 3-isopropylmalate dehydratase large subunit [Deltaproteobacteria bacterium]|nr:3-isopropylmalate dehydratase large subunit [Deltaproteobacteria bacterium]MBW2129938.1 3-isopropylmalate dehydratase large subunit [Deltaproteobacteria bacterium]
MNIAEKILARASGKSRVSPNEYVTAKIDMAMMPENFRLIRNILKKSGIREESFRIWDPDRFVAIIDHRVPPASLATAESHRLMRDLARRLKVKHFYDVFPGVCHQVMVEKGHVLPGNLIVGADSHTTTYGALNAASTGIGASEMAYVLYTGELWFRVPETIQIEVSGRLPDHVLSKDIILLLAGRFGTDMAQYKAIEWTGSAVEALSLDARLTMSNMSVELGAKFGLFEADEKTLSYVNSRTDRPFEPVKPDTDANYAQSLTVDGSTLEPQVALPHNVGNVRKASEVQDVHIDQAVIASCCHGRLEDMEIAAKMLKGRKVHPGVRFYVSPASWDEYKAAMEKGILGALMGAGVMIGNPSCGFCTGFQGVLAKGERCIAAAPRNFKGRMGSPDAEIYLGSPATVTASAITGKITDPREVM